VDAVCDGEDVWIAGVMEHIEEAGVHSGDSACSLPPHSLPKKRSKSCAAKPKRWPRRSREGLMNVQFAVKDGEVFLIEVNPRASRTVPFVAKTIGAPVAKIAAKVMAGAKLKDLDDPERTSQAISRSRKRSCRLPASPASTRCWGRKCAPPAKSWASMSDFESAFAKAELGAGVASAHESGAVFVSLKESDKAAMVEPCRS
jgi:carbamoyl-phosphate synthase large subunit